MLCFCVLQQPDAGLFTFLNGILIPDGGLDLTDVAAAHHQHTQAALANTAADGQRQLVLQQHLVEGEGPAVIAAGFRQLTVQGFRVHTDTHGRDLQGPAQNLIPEEDIAVQVPVIVVRGAAVMGLAGAELPADLHDAGGVVFLHIGLFPLGAGLQIRIHILQCLGGDEGDLPVQLGAKLGKPDMEAVIGIADGPDDGTDDELQIFGIPVFPGNDLFPVPLVHIDGMDIVQLFVPADGVHIGVQAVAQGEVVPLQGQPLPFCQGMDYLGIHSHSGNIEGYRPFHTAQVVIQTGALGDEQRSGNALQVQRLGKLLLKGFFDIGNGPLGVVGIQNGGIILGDVDLIHNIPPFRNKI